MNDLYNFGKNNEVVQFADKALQGSSFMDQRIIFEIRYLLCSALAKLRKDRFKDEVMKIEGADHEFLFGFYYNAFDGRFQKFVNITCFLTKTKNESHKAIRFLR